jgi:hypothetical protein
MNPTLNRAKVTLMMDGGGGRINGHPVQPAIVLPDGRFQLGLEPKRSTLWSTSPSGVWNVNKVPSIWTTFVKTRRSMTSHHGLWSL